MSARERMDRFYRAVRAVARFWLWFFFKAVDVRHPERVPREGPVLLCINHPNNFIDSFVVGAAVRRKVHYLATAALFRNPLVARFLLAAGAIPVYRKQDDPGKMNKNSDTFAACAAGFEHNALIAIYPEGTTHAEARVQRIKTGAARIALAWEAAHPRTLRVLPVGLTFEARKSFRARVLVSFGPPLPLHAYADAYREDPVKAVDALTRHLQEAMEAEVVNVERIDDARLLQSIEALYRDVLARAVMEARGVGPRDVDLVRLSRSIVEAIGWFKAREPERVEAIWLRIRAYRALLAQYHLRDETVRARLERLPARRRIVSSWDAIVGFPFFLYGTLVNLLPYLVPRWLARRTARKETDYATVRLLASIVAVPVFYGLETWLVFRAAGGLAAALGDDRVSLSGWRRAVRQSPPVRRADGDASGVGAAAGGRARGDRRRAGARQDRVAHRHQREQLLSVHLLEEMSTPAVDALDRAKTVVLLTISPLETHGPHLPVGVDAFTARHFAQTIADRLVAARPGWSAVLVPTLHLGSFTFDSVGTVTVRQRVVRAALDEAAALVSRRHGITMASFTGHLAWEFMRGHYATKIEAVLGRSMSDEERRAFAEDAHGGWWETSLMLLLRPDLVDESYRTLPPARYSWPERILPNYALRKGGLGYVGHPALADSAFARATTDVLMTEAMAIVDGLLDGTLSHSARRSAFSRVPLFRTNFWPAAAGVTAGLGALAVGVAGFLLRRRPPPA